MTDISNYAGKIRGSFRNFIKNNDLTEAKQDDPLKLETCKRLLKYSKDNLVLSDQNIYLKFYKKSDELLKLRALRLMTRKLASEREGLRLGKEEKMLNAIT